MGVTMKISVGKVKNILLFTFLIFFLVFTGNYPNGRIEILLIFVFSLASISLTVFKGILRINSIFIIPLLYFIYCLSDISNGISSSSNTVNLAICLALIITFAQYAYDESDVNIMIRIIFLAFLISGPIIGLYQMVNGGFVFPDTGASVYYNYKIFNSQQSNENYSALTMVIPFFLSLFLFSSSNSNAARIFYTATSIVSFICLLLTFSRGTIAGVVIALLLLMFSILKHNKDIFKQVTLTKIFLVILIIIVVISLYSYAEQFVNSLDVQNLLEKKSMDSLEVRVTQWKSIVQVMLNTGLKNMFLGYGLDYPNVVGSVSGHYISAHNIFLGHLIQNGIVGFACILCLFLNSIKKSLEIFKTDDIGGKYIAALVLTMWIAYQFVSMIRWELWFSIIVLELYYSSRFAMIYQAQH